MPDVIMLCTVTNIHFLIVIYEQEPELNSIHHAVKSTSSTGNVPCTLLKPWLLRGQKGSLLYIFPSVANKVLVVCINSIRHTKYSPGKK